MKKSDSAKRRPSSGIRWDEQNLEENEKIKAQLPSVKVNEPKTPYHGPLDDTMDVEEDGLAPLTLDDHNHQETNSNGNHAIYHNANGNHHSMDLEPEQQIAQPSDNNRSGFSSDSEPHSRASNAGELSHLSKEEQEEHRKKFEQWRRRHYNMKEALKKAKELLSSEDGEDDPVDSDDEHT